jgi:hypothetical protein
MLADMRDYAVVERPKAETGPGGLHLPEFEVVPVEGPDSEKWGELSWPDKVEQIASQTVPEGEKLWIYYSQAYPPFIQQRKKIENRDTALSASFENRYRIWIAAHALILEKDRESTEMKELFTDTPDEYLDKSERLERCRFAAIAALYAARDVLSEPVAVEAQSEA